jgi:prolyl oligopeptidase
MKKTLLLLTACLLGHLAFAQYQYPASKTVEVSDTIFGTVVTDPYRWLEDVKSEEVLDWFRAQAEFTNSEMSKIANQDKLIDELKRYDGMRSVAYSPISKAGGKYFYEKRLPSEQVYKLYYRQGINGEEVLLFDPQKFKEGKTFEFSASVNDNGSKIALNLSEAGTEIGDIYILDVATITFLPDIIPHSSGTFM